MKRKDNIFLDAMFRRPESNMFDHSHEVKYSTNFGDLVPSCLHEVLPGDVWHLGSTDFARMLPMKTPVMHRFRTDKYWFFVPNRILWEQFPDWIFDADSADENPYVTISDVVPVGSLADYMGIPPGDYSTVPGGYKVNLLPFAAYYLIHDEFFKQQFIETPQFSELVPGENAGWLDFVIARPLIAAWEKDYFTTCLPFPQDSASGVQIPLTFQENVPVTMNDPDERQPARFVDQDNASSPLGVLSMQNGPFPFDRTVKSTDGNPAWYDPNGSLVVDVQSDAALITDLRRAFRLQEFLEKIITGGKRYIETLMTIFGVRSSDARLQRPEYIFRQSGKITISEVLSTVESDVAAPLGTMGGHGISATGGDGGSYRAEEHGWILALSVIRPDTSYQDGIARHFSRVNPLDYAVPDFALIGEQAVLTKELQALIPDTAPVQPDTVFGYQKRYAEYMYTPSRVAGELRTSLAEWQAGRVFDDPDAPPTLNAEFIQCLPRYDFFAVTDPDEQHIIVNTVNHSTVLRKLPRHAIPTI